MRLVAIEPARGTATPLLRAQGYTVDCFSRLHDGSAALRAGAYQAVLVAERLPDGDGIGWVRSFRAQGHRTPALVLGVSNRTEERIRALEAGADDCMPPCVDGRELVARVRAVLRRPADAAESWIEAGNIRIEPNSRDLRIGESQAAVARREFDLLAHLMRRHRRVVSRAALEALLYGHAEYITSNSLDVCVSRLRQHLAANSADHRVETIRGEGYRLTPIEAAAPVPQAALRKRA